MNELDQSQTDAFAKLLSELKAWNEHTNITAIRDDEGITKKHFLDSQTVIQAIPAEAKTLIDIGSGAGFPGFPIAIVRKDLEITLLEATLKKIKFLEHIVKTLGLSNVKTISERAESAGQNPSFREQFDVATARGVAELPTLLELTLPFLKIGGILIAQKNAGDDEVRSAKNALEVLGGVLEKQIPVRIPGLEDRQLIIIKKVKATPKEYPRRIGVPAKKPL